MKFYEEKLLNYEKDYKINQTSTIFTKINEESFIIEDEFVNCIVRITPVNTFTGVSFFFSKKMDIVSGILQKTFQKLKLKTEIDVVFTSVCDEYRHFSLYVSSILTKYISMFLNLKTKTNLLTKFKNIIVVDPTPQEIELCNNYFYMVEQGDILYAEAFNYEDIENDGFYEEIKRKISN